MEAVKLLLVVPNVNPTAGATRGPFGMFKASNPVYVAASEGHTEVVKLLLTHPAIVNPNAGATVGRRRLYPG